MDYHIPSENRVVTARELKKWAYPTGLGNPPQPHQTEPLGAFKIVVDPMPEVTAMQVAEPKSDAEVYHQDGVSRRGWSVRDKAPEQIADEKAVAKAAMLAWIDGFLAPLMRGYTQAEIQSWGVKGPAAERFDAGEANATDMLILQAEADTLGITVADLVARILPRSRPYTKAIAITSALRQVTSAQIDAATLDQVDDILDAAKAQAVAKAQQIGLPVGAQG